ncbi:MAG: hypothetical protein NTY41_00020 [Proteobacteria bacterium]|nr:hypothetical protein [Pseudomonadota bacterium]
MNTLTDHSSTGRHAPWGWLVLSLAVWVAIYAEGLDGVERDPKAASEWAARAQAFAH